LDDEAIAKEIVLQNTLGMAPNNTRKTRLIVALAGLPPVMFIQMGFEGALYDATVCLVQADLM